MLGENKVINCISCKKLIAKGTINDGIISIKCKCGTVNTIEKEAKELKVETKELNLNGSPGTSGIVFGDFDIQRIST